MTYIIFEATYENKIRIEREKEKATLSSSHLGRESNQDIEMSILSSATGSLLTHVLRDVRR